jgi:hypothetical protein
MEDVKLIFVTGQLNQPDDPDFGPFKLEVILRPPEFMNVMFIMLHGGSEIVVARGKTKEALEAFMEKEKLKTHPRFVRYEITEPKEVNKQVA